MAAELTGALPQGLIGVDWGSSNVRAFLIDRGGRTIARRERSAPLRTLAGSHASVLAELIASWREDVPGMPILLSGMVGSREGWHDAGYCGLPADPATVAAHCLTVEDGGLRASIVPGLRQGDEGGESLDFMRGEEVQLFGALALTGASGGIFCLPGTHSKWIVVEAGRITAFRTYMTGDLFEVLKTHSVLSFTTRDETALPGAAFDAALARTVHGEGPLGQLFSVRALNLSGRYGRAEATAYLSGLLIGHEVDEALRRFRAEDGTPVRLICDPQLGRLYRRALEWRGLGVEAIDGAAAAAAGLATIASLLPVGERP
jgi:2-dehydro-3-deoxygalactonokinase